MPTPPAFDPSHMYVEQVLVLKAPEGHYGRIVSLYPITEGGEPDQFSGRIPLHTGHVNAIGQTTNSGTVQIPLQFPLPGLDIHTACLAFFVCAEKALADFQAEAFRRTITSPGIVTQ